MKDLFGFYSSFLNAARGIEADRRALDAEAFAHAARLRASVIEQWHLEQEASGKLGNAGLGNLLDARHAGLLNPAGLFLGALEGEPIFLNGDGHHLVYARTGDGKGTTSIQPNLAHYTGSMFVIDLKDGELHYSTARHRAERLGHKVIVLDPWSIRGSGSVRVCPLARLRQIAECGERLDDEAEDIALILLPRVKGDGGENGWVKKGARRLLSMRMKYLAYEAPDLLSLTELWRFVNASDLALQASFAVMESCGREDVSGPAGAMFGVYKEASKQFEAYRQEAIEALASFSPGSALAEATSANEIDFSVLKHEPVTVYLSVPSKKIGVAAPWLAMTLNHAIEQIAAATGPQKVRFILDEMAQLPPVPAVSKALRLYRGRGILLSMYCQGRFSLADAGWPETLVKEIEDQASCIQMWGVEDPSLLKDIEYWSGNSTVVQVEPSHSGGQVAQGSFGRREQKRPVLQVEDIRRIREERQIVKLPGFPLFVTARVPYWHVTPWKLQIRDVRDLHEGRTRP